MTGKRPLEGERVIVTRAAHQAERLVSGFSAAGARVERLPLVEVIAPPDPRPLERAASELALYDWLVFASANAVAAFLPLTGGSLPPGLRVAVVGESTARAVASYGAVPNLVALEPRAEGLVRALTPHLGRRQRLLLPQAADARPTLGQGLAAAGGEPVTVVAYAKRLPPEAPDRARELFSHEPLGWVTFTSPSIVRHFIELLEPDWEARRSELAAASIGGVTSRELRRAGVEPGAEARAPGDAPLVEAVVRASSL